MTYQQLRPSIRQIIEERTDVSGLNKEIIITSLEKIAVDFSITEVETLRSKVLNLEN